MDEKLILNALWMMFHGLTNLLLGPPCQSPLLTTSLLYHELKKSYYWSPFDGPHLRFFYTFWRWVRHLLDHEPKKSRSIYKHFLVNFFLKIFDNFLSEGGGEVL